MTKECWSSYHPVLWLRYALQHHQGIVISRVNNLVILRYVPFACSDSLRAPKHNKLSTEVSSGWACSFRDNSNLPRDFYKKLCGVFCDHVYTWHWRQVHLLGAVFKKSCFIYTCLVIKSWLMACFWNVDTWTTSSLQMMAVFSTLISHLYSVEILNHSLHRWNSVKKWWKPWAEQKGTMFTNSMNLWLERCI